MREMKSCKVLRTLSILALLAMSAGLFPAVTLEITNPVGGLYHNGEAMAIKWKVDGTVPNSGEVRITLHDEATQLVAVIAAAAPNNGTYYWGIPADLAAKRYVIRVRIKGTNVQDDCYPFLVNPQVIVALPPGGAYEETRTYLVTWQFVGPKPSTKFDVKINYDYSGPNEGPAILIGENVPLNGPLQWTVPGNIPIGYYDMKFFLKNAGDPYLSPLLKQQIQIVLHKTMIKVTK